MNPEDDFEDEAHEIFSSLGNLVGVGEIEARKIMGDEQYEKTVALMEASSELGLRKDASQVKYFEALAAMQTSVSIFILLTSVLSIAWSFYFWFK